MTIYFLEVMLYAEDISAGANFAAAKQASMINVATVRGVRVHCGLPTVGVVRRAAVTIDIT